MQTILPVILASTYPGVRGISESGFKGCLAQGNQVPVLVPITTMFITGLANLAFIGPATTNVMIKRKHQGDFVPNIHPVKTDGLQKPGMAKRVMTGDPILQR